MNDLIIRLREDCLGPRLSDEAADEIDRLRAALAHIVRHQEKIGGGLAVLSTTRRIAQDALNY